MEGRWGIPEWADLGVEMVRALRWPVVTLILAGLLHPALTAWKAAVLESSACPGAAELVKEGWIQAGVYGAWQADLAAASREKRKGGKGK